MNDIQYKMKEFSEMLEDYNLHEDYWIEITAIYEATTKSFLFNAIVWKSEGDYATDIVDFEINNQIHKIDIAEITHAPECETGTEQEVIAWCDRLIEELGNDLEEITILEREVA